MGNDEAMNEIRNQTKQHIGQLIANALKARRITQAAAGRQLGVSPRSITYWQQGQSFPAQEYQKTLENMLGWQEGALGRAITLGLSGAPLETFTAAWMEGRAEVPGLSDLADDDLGQELLGRLRNKDLEIRRLRAELEQAKRQLSQPDYSLAAHQAEPSMLERFAAEDEGRGSLDTP